MCEVVIKAKHNNNMEKKLYTILVGPLMHRLLRLQSIEVINHEYLYNVRTKRNQKVVDLSLKDKVVFVSLSYSTSSDL